MDKVSQPSASSIYPWKERHRARVFSRKIFSIDEVHRVEASSETVPSEGQFLVMEATDWVNMVVLTADQQVVLIEQWRHGVSHTTLEVPGGMIDPGESPLEAAQRELREETGYEASQWTAIGCIEPNPAIQSNRCHTFLAVDAKRMGEPNFGENERCRLVLEPFDKLDAMVLSGHISHALVVVAIYYAQHHLRSPSTPAKSR